MIFILYSRNCAISGNNANQGGGIYSLGQAAPSLYSSGGAVFAIIFAINDIFLLNSTALYDIFIKIGNTDFQ